MNINNHFEEDQIYFKDLFFIAWKFKISIILVTCIAAVSSVAYSLQIPNKYKSEALMSLSESSGSTSDLSRYSGIAAMAGINIPQSGNEDKISLAIETIKSREIVERLIEDEMVLINLMAPKKFNWGTNNLEINTDIYDIKNSEWVRTPSGPFKAKPSSLEAHRAFMKAVSIKRDGSFFTIAIEHISPFFAKSLLEKVITEVNNINREKDKEESSLALEYLRNEFAKTSVNDIRQSINTIISGQLQKQMLVNVKEEYLISHIDKPFVPEFKTSPNRATICIMGTIFGFIFGLILALVRTFISKNYK